jgi:hypothetical protein
MPRTHTNPIGNAPATSSLPGLTRQSIKLLGLKILLMDARVKPAHDE